MTSPSPSSLEVRCAQRRLDPEAVQLLHRLSFPLPSTSSASPPAVGLDAVSLLDLLLHCNAVHALSFWVLRSLAKELREESSSPLTSPSVAVSETTLLCEALQYAEEALDRQLTSRVLAPVLFACLSFYVDATAYDHAALRRDVQALLTTGGGGPARYCRDDDVDDGDMHAESLWEPEGDAEEVDDGVSLPHTSSTHHGVRGPQACTGALGDEEAAQSGAADQPVPPPAPSPPSAAMRRRWHRERRRTATAAPPQTDVGVLMLRLCAALLSSSSSTSSSITHRPAASHASETGGTNTPPPPWLFPSAMCSANPSPLPRDEDDANAERRWCAIAWNPRVVAALLRRGGACLTVPRTASTASPASHLPSGLPARLCRGLHRHHAAGCGGGSRGITEECGVVVTVATSTSLALTRWSIDSSSSSSSTPAVTRSSEAARGQPKRLRAREGGGARVGGAASTRMCTRPPCEGGGLCAEGLHTATATASTRSTSASEARAVPHWSSAAHHGCTETLCLPGVDPAYRSGSLPLTLPIELQRHCLEYVTPRYMRTVSMVCRRWYGLLRHGDPSSSLLRRAMQASTAVTHAYARFFAHEWGEQTLPVALLTPLHRLRLALQVLPGGPTTTALLQRHWQRARRDADVCLYTRDHYRRSGWGVLADDAEGRHAHAYTGNPASCVRRESRSPPAPWQGDRQPLSVILYVYYVLRVLPTAASSSACSVVLLRDGADVRETLLTVLHGFAAEFKWADLWTTRRAGGDSLLQRESMRQQRLVWWLLANPSTTTTSTSSTSYAVPPPSRHAASGVCGEADDIFAQLLAHWLDVRKVWLRCQTRVCV